MWSDIMENNLQVIEFRNFRAEPTNRPVEYEYKSIRKDAVKTAGVSNTNTYV